MSTTERHERRARAIGTLRNLNVDVRRAQKALEDDGRTPFAEKAHHIEMLVESLIDDLHYNLWPLDQARNLVRPLIRNERVRYFLRRHGDHAPRLHFNAHHWREAHHGSPMPNAEPGKWGDPYPITEEAAKFLIERWNSTSNGAYTYELVP